MEERGYIKTVLLSPIKTVQEPGRGGFSSEQWWFRARTNFSRYGSADVSHKRFRPIRCHP
jgi:hypothetical protein